MVPYICSSESGECSAGSLHGLLLILLLVKIDKVVIDTVSNQNLLIFQADMIHY